MLRVGIEAGVVGIILGISFSIVKLLLFPIESFVPNVLIVFLLGAGLHVLFEITGLNAKFCANFK